MPRRRRGTRTADHCFQPSTVVSSPSQLRTNHPHGSPSRADGEVGTGGEVGGRRAYDVSPTPDGSAIGARNRNRQLLKKARPYPVGVSALRLVGFRV